MLHPSFKAAILFAWLSVFQTQAFVLHPSYNASRHNKALVVQNVRRDGPDPGDFSWIKRWAAIGDSFTAGIGSGHIYSQRDDDFKCSRYSHSYAALVDTALGPAIQNFQFAACSGDRSVQIYDQVNKLEGDLDLVMLTAGGNDLCLAGIIKTCVFLPFGGEKKCQDFIDKAQANIDSILKPNLKDILLNLNNKMTKDSIVIFNQYAQYFNTDNDDCAKKQDWNLFSFQGGHPLRLTIDRRKKFNTLVVNINNAIQEVVDDVYQHGNVKYKLYSSNWDPWPIEGVDGQMCSPKSSGKYPDPDQPDLQFFKPNTEHFEWVTDTLNRRDKPFMGRRSRQRIERSTDIYESLLYKSENPANGALHKLNPRAPEPPGCPGDGKFDWATLGMGVPDSFGKFFHPNEQGHETMAAWALENVIMARAEVLNIDNPICEFKNELKCWKVDGRHAYAGAGVMNKNIQAFCDDVKPPDHTVGWRWEKPFHEGTPDEHTFSLQLSDQATSFDKDECLKSFDKIVNGCKDGDDPQNPMAWRFGGRYVQDAYTYEINVKRDNRPWPPIQKTDGRCEGWYKVFFSAYQLKGSGWSTWDSGQETIKPSMQGCLGLGITQWDFKYFDAPDKDGMEWQLNFHTPIWVRARCFKNQKVAIASGGSTDGCGGNDA